MSTHKYDLRLAQAADLKAPHIGVIDFTVPLPNNEKSEQQYLFTGDVAYAQSPLECMHWFLYDHHNYGPVEGAVWESYLDCGFARDPLELVRITEMKPSGAIVWSNGPIAHFTINNRWHMIDGTHWVKA